MRFGQLLSVCAACVCCGGPVTFVWQQYEGPPRSKNSLAIIRSSGASSTVLVAIDGKSILAPLEHDNRLHLEVLPGIHEIDVAAPSIGLSRVIPVRLLAEAGKVYRVEVLATPPSRAQPDNGEPPLWDEQWQAHAYEVDRETDAPRGVADAPAAPAAPASEARPRLRENTSGVREGGTEAAGSERAHDAGLADQE